MVRKGLTSPAARAGRPRGFDADRALDAAMRVFWRKGFEGASLADLTKAMGINRPSLYAAFGNKQELFQRALDRYAQGPAAFVQDAIAQPTARKVVEHLFRGTIDLLADPHNPRGCLAVQSALACSKDADAVRLCTASQRTAAEISLRERFRQAVKTGDLPASADPAALARFISAVMHGMSVQASGGAGRAELRAVAQTAMQAWPR